jgi:hypothetical protein
MFNHEKEIREQNYFWIVAIFFALTLCGFFGYRVAHAQVINPGVQYVGSPAANNDCIKASVSGGNFQGITTSGGACASAVSGANPSATAGPNAINGSASTFMRSDAAPPVQIGSASQEGILEVDGTGICASAGVISLCSPYPTVPTAANPTATAGPSANNGVASTYMRSDASPVVQEGSSSQLGLLQCNSTDVICNSSVLELAAFTGDISKSAGSVITKVVAVQNEAFCATAPTNNYVWAWNSGSSQWCPVAAGSGTVTNISTGNGVAGGPITTTGTITANVDESTITDSGGPLVVSNTIIAGQTCTPGSSCGLAIPLSNSISNNISLTAGSYVTGPTISQGATGTWCATGTVTFANGSNTDIYYVKLWDGTTVISSASEETTSSTDIRSITLSGCEASPAGNLNMAVEEVNHTGTMYANESGAGHDSNITAFRIR